jgi:polysaccharide pyruvyl transferase WcaK-like protein
VESPLGYVDVPAKQKVRTYFNSVGGNGIGFLSDGEKRFLSSVVESSSYFSVRDSRTKQLIHEHLGVDVPCTPDCAVLISKYFSARTGSSDFDLDSLGLVPGQYCIVQFNRSIYSIAKEKIVSELIKVFYDHHLPICLMPIGTAAFHEDDIVLEDLYNELRLHNINAVYCRDRHVFSIMGLIRHAAFVVCTSLHGRITALSFDVPRVTVLYGDSKQESYIQTWESEIADISIERDLNIAEAVKRVLDVDPQVYANISKSSIAQAESAGLSLVSMARIGAGKSGREIPAFNAEYVRNPVLESFIESREMVRDLSIMVRELKALNANVLACDEKVRNLDREVKSLNVWTLVKRFLQRLSYKILR